MPSDEVHQKVCNFINKKNKENPIKIIISSIKPLDKYN